MNYDPAHRGAPPDASAPPQSFRETLDEVERLMRSVLPRVAQLLDQTRHVQQLDREILAATEDATPVLQNIVSEVPGRLGVDHVNIMLLKEGKLTVVQSSDPRWIGYELPLNKSLCGQVLHDDRDMYVPDVTKYEPKSYCRFHEATKSEILLRIRDQDGRHLGVLTMERSQPPTFNEEEFEFAQVLAGQVAIAVEHSKLMASVQRLHRLTLDLLVGRSAPDTAYQQILEATLDVLGCPYGQVLLRVENQLLLIASSQPDDVGLVVGPLDSVCSHYLLEEDGRKPLMINDIHNSKYARYYLDFEIAGKRADMHSEMVLPILDGDRVMGCINLESPDPAAFSQFHERVVDTAGAMIQRSLASLLARAGQTGHVEGAQRALEQMGYMANSLLHTFNGALDHAITGVRDVLEMKELRTLKTSLRGSPSVAEHLNGEIEYLKKAKMMLADLRTRFNPNDPGLQLSRRNVVSDLTIVINQFLDQRGRRQEITVSVDIDIPEKRRLGQDGVSCWASKELLPVFEDLMDNAADAIRTRMTDEPGHAGKIDVRLDLPNPFMLRLCVRDNGCGVPAELREKIFEYRFSTKSGNPGERGVGLWFCRNYLKDLGGRIELNPEHQDGAEFVLTIPTLLS